MDISSVAYKPKTGRVKIEWTVIRNAGGVDATETFTIDGDDAPHSDFLNAFKNLRAVAGECLEIDADRKTINELLTVHKVAFQSKGKRGMGVVLTVQRKLEWTGTPMTVNTPYSPIDDLPHKTAAKILKTLRTEAANYVGGKRQQVSMDFTEGGPNEETDGAGESDDDAKAA